MKKYSIFYLKELIEAMNHTREQLEKSVCKPMHIYLIEKVESEPSLFLLNNLSSKLAEGLSKYNEMYSNNTYLNVNNEEDYGIVLKGLPYIKKGMKNYKTDKEYQKNIAKIYVIVLYNLSMIYIANNELDRAEEMIEKSIEISIKEYYSRLLPNLIYSKFTLLYKKGNYEEAINNYVQSRFLFKIAKQINLWVALEEIARIEFPDLIDFLNEIDLPKR